MQDECALIPKLSFIPKVEGLTRIRYPISLSSELWPSEGSCFFKIRFVPI